MAVIKCKMCGGDLDISEGLTVCECEYCGTKQTVPTVDDEKKITLFNRAGRLLRGCEFDKAAGVFESIVADFPEEAEAYWGLVLCKFGIEYVDDPATGKKVPTCHRSGFDSVMEDADFEQACENADAIARRQYREEAKAIEELRRGIIEVSGKEQPYDIFICYKETDENGGRTVDSVIAQDVYDALTAKGYRVFFSRITLEDKLGQEYEPYIFAALNSAKIMLAFGTDFEYYNAVWVKNEWSRFLKLMEKDKSKHLIPCYKGIDAYDMPKEFARLQAQDMGKVGAVQDLLRGIEKLLPKQKAEVQHQPAVQQVVQTAGGPNVAALLKRAAIFLEDGNWQSADEYAEKVLDLDPENAEAYLVKLLASVQLRSVKELSGLLLQEEETGVWEPGTIELIGYPPEYKIKMIKYIQEVTGLGLAESKTTVENLPFTFKAEADVLAALDEMKATYRRVDNSGVVARRADPRTIEESAAYQRFLRYAPKAQAEEVQGYLKQAKEETARYAEKARIAREKWEEEVRIAREKREEEARIAREKWEEEERIAREKKAEEERIAAEKRAEEFACVRTCLADPNCPPVGVSAGRFHTLGLRSDGTVLAAGQNNKEQCNVHSWRDIVAVSAGLWHTIGARKDGTVVATGRKDGGRCSVNGWRDIVAVSTHNEHTVGLRKDGTVVACGENSFGQCDVGGWRNIVAVSAGADHTVGLRKDGTVVACGYSMGNRCSVSGWRDIVAVSAGADHTVGLRKNGTVVAVGNNIDGQCKVSDWSDIVAVSAGYEHTVGLKADGTVVACGTNEHDQCEVKKWRDIVAVSAGNRHTVGLKADGTVVTCGSCYGMGSWKLFDGAGDLKRRIEQARRAEEERAEEARAKAEAERQTKIAALNKEKNQLAAELPNIKGLFSGGKRKQIEARLAEIDAELAKLQ